MMDFSKLTKAEIDCMNYHAFTGFAGGKFGGAKTLESLVKKGFLVAHERSEPSRPFMFKWIEYKMPVAVHVAWCEHVAKDCDEDV